MQHGTELAPGRRPAQSQHRLSEDLVQRKWRQAWYIQVSHYMVSCQQRFKCPEKSYAVGAVAKQLRSLGPAPKKLAQLCSRLFKDKLRKKV